MDRRIRNQQAPTTWCLFRTKDPGHVVLFCTAQEVVSSLTFRPGNQQCAMLTAYSISRLLRSQNSELQSQVQYSTTFFGTTNQVIQVCPYCTMGPNQLDTATKVDYGQGAEMSSLPICHALWIIRGDLIELRVSSSTCL